MSVFILPSTTQAYHPFTGDHHSPSHGGRRCAGRMMTTDVRSPFDAFFGNMTNGNVNHTSIRHHPFFSQEVEEEEEDDQLTQYFLHQQQRRQAVQFALARRQAEIEHERERERRRIRNQQIEHQRHRRAAFLAQIAWQEEQARLHRLAIAEEQQRQYRKRQERATAAAAAALQQRELHLQEQQWQEIASHGLATALQFAEWFGGVGDEQKDTEMTEKTENRSEDTVVKDNGDQFTSQPEQISVPITNDEQDPPEEDISKDTASEPIPIFTHPLPNDPHQRASLNAKDIQVAFDQPTNTIKVSGLWNVNTNENEDGLVALPSSSSSSSSSVTTNDDQEEHRGRKRSRSPKRSRVSDVDEVTGEEIVVDQEENTDGFVNVATGKQPQGTMRIPLPNDANISNLRAELTDEGFKLFL